MLKALDLDNNTLIILACVVGALVILGVVLLIVLSRKNKVIKEKQSKEEQVDQTKIVDGVKVSVDETKVGTADNPDVTLHKNDLQLQRGVEYLVGKGREVIPGTYTILTSNEQTSIFNIRINGLVRPHKHLTEIVLKEGDKISPVSINIILR